MMRILFVGCVESSYRLLAELMKKEKQIVGLKLEKGSMYKSVVEEIAKIPEVVECHCTTGQYTLFLKMYARDNSQLMDILNNKIQAIHGVDSTETLISLDQSIKKEVPIVADEDDAN